MLLVIFSHSSLLSTSQIDKNFSVFWTYSVLSNKCTNNNSLNQMFKIIAKFKLTIHYKVNAEMKTDISDLKFLDKPDNSKTSLKLPEAVNQRRRRRRQYNYQHITFKNLWTCMLIFVIFCLEVTSYIWFHRFFNHTLQYLVFLELYNYQ